MKEGPPLATRRDKTFGNESREDVSQNGYLGRLNSTIINIRNGYMGWRREKWSDMAPLKVMKCICSLRSKGSGNFIGSLFSDK